MPGYKVVFITLLICFSLLKLSAQDIGLFNLHGSIQRSYINPGLPITGKINVAAGNYQLGIATDGPALNDLTSFNAAGKRFVDISKFPNAFDDLQNIYLQNKISSLDISFKVGNIVFTAGHSFNLYGSLSYTKDLALLLAQGNAAFIGQTLEIGPGFTLNAYNDLYVGAQYQMGKWTAGIRPRLLFGTAGMETLKNTIRFTTDEAYYQLRFENEYIIRSSALFRISTFDEIEFSYPNMRFDNLFYNNSGFALDAGLSYAFSDKTELSASITDFGKIKWDFFPRVFTSRGSFTYEGVDLINYISDSTGINIADSLVNLFEFNQTIAPFTTVLPSKIYLGFSHQLNDQWRFSALYRMEDFRFSERSALSLSAVCQISLLNLGVNYTMRRNNFSSVGLSASIRLKPILLYVATENIFALIKPFDQKLANINFGAGLKF